MLFIAFIILIYPHFPNDIFIFLFQVRIISHPQVLQVKLFYFQDGNVQSILFFWHFAKGGIVLKLFILMIFVFAKKIAYNVFKILIILFFRRNVTSVRFYDSLRIKQEPEYYSWSL